MSVEWGFILGYQDSDVAFSGVARPVPSSIAPRVPLERATTIEKKLHLPVDGWLCPGIE